MIGENNVFRDLNQYFLYIKHSTTELLNIVMAMNNNNKKKGRKESLSIF